MGVRQPGLFLIGECPDLGSGYLRLRSDQGFEGVSGHFVPWLSARRRVGQAPLPRGTHGQNACLAAVAIRDALRKGLPQWQTLSIGVWTGSLVVGDGPGPQVRAPIGARHLWPELRSSVNPQA